MAGRETPADSALRAYLAALDAALTGVPAAERREILLETRSHVLERTAREPERSADDVLTELGPPAVYARQFLADAGTQSTPRQAAADAAGDVPSGATARVGGSVTLRALAQLTARGWRGIPALGVAAVAYMVVGILLLFVLGELTEPEGTGVFVRPRAHGRPAISVLMVGGDATVGRDVLGRWFLLICAALIAGIHVLTRALVRRVAFGARRGSPAARPTLRP